MNCNGSPIQFDQKFGRGLRSDSCYDFSCSFCVKNAEQLPDGFPGSMIFLCHGLTTHKKGMEICCSQEI